MATAAIVFLYFQAREQEAREHTLATKAEERVGAVQGRLRDCVKELETVRAFFNSSDAVTMAEFATFAQSVLGQRPDVHTLQWGKDGHASCGPAALMPTNHFHLVYSQTRDETTNLPNQFWSHPACLAAIRQAQTTGLAAVSGEIKMGNGGQSWFVMYLPVGHWCAEQQRSSGTAQCGMIAAVLSYRDLVESAVALLKPGGVDFVVYDGLVARHKEPVYSHISRTRTANESMMHLVRSMSPLTLPINAAGREWSVECRASPKLVAAHRQYAPELAASGVLVLTALFAYFVAGLARRSEKIKQLVTESTRELTATNLRLATALEEHQQAEERYRSIFRNAVEGMFQSTPEGRYLRVNPALAEMYGYATPDEMKHQVQDITTQVYVNASSREEFRQRIEEAGAVRGFEYEVRRRDGKVIWISEHARAVRNAEGKLICYEGSVQDITERKLAEAQRARLEMQLNQAQKMEAIGTLAGGIAHDFNNILTAIIGYTELVLDDATQPLHTRNCLTRVAEAANRAKELVRQILAFSRQQTSERHPIQLSIVIKEALRLLRATLPSTIEIKRYINTDSDWVLADAVQMHQVLMNLCTNAAHAMHERGGLLEVCLDEIVLRQSNQVAHLPAGRYLRLSVRDTGHGIDPALLDKIFDPFFTTKPVGEGTGLGLSVVHGILQNHSGAIRVESQPGAGTRFALFLPATAQQAESSKNTTKTASTGTGRILIVDDEPVIVEMLEQRLAHLGYKVTAETDSVRALEVLRSSPSPGFDLIITDYTMPNLTGVELARAVQTLEQCPPIILCSGNIQHLPQSEKGLTGICQVVTKPFEMHTLSSAIRSALNASTHSS